MLNIQHCICTSHLTQGTCQSSKIAANDNNTQKNRAVHEQIAVRICDEEREKERDADDAVFKKKANRKDGNREEGV